MSSPRVTVLMSVYNSEKYLREAIDSILNQTFKDFEFLITNDGSKDKSLQIIKDYKDKRIRLISRENKGLVASLNEGIGLAKGEYIARQDSDDISVPTRLAKEVAFLDANPQVGLVGSNYSHIDMKSKKTGTTTNIFTHPDDLKVALVTCNQYGHGSVMIRKSVLDKTGVYDKSVGYVEDYDLWVRISRVADVANIEESLYLWRKNEAGITLTNQQLQIDQTLAVRDRAFEDFLKHRLRYKLFRFHPSGERYRDRKAILYRDFAYMYKQRGKLIRSLIMLCTAAIVQPRNRQNLSYIKRLLRHPRSFTWEYEWL